MKGKESQVGSNPQRINRPPPTAQTSSAASTTATEPDAAATADDTERLIADHKQRLSRLNALSGYVAGFVALDLPPQIVGQAKEIILSGWQAAANARKGARSMEEISAATDPIRHEMDEQLSALLGQDAYKQLQVYQLESHFDWTIGTDMWDGGAPLSADQLHALALAAVETKYKEGDFAIEPKPAQTPDSTTGLSSQDVALLTASSHILTQAQQGVLRQNLIDDNRYNAAMHGFAAKQRQLWGTGP